MSKKLEKLQEQMAKIQEQIQAEEQRQKDEAVKRRNKMINIIGTFHLDQAEKNGGTAALASALDKAGYLKRPADRALFDLPKESKPKAEARAADAQ